MRQRGGGNQGTYMVDGSSEIRAHVWSEIGNLICLRHLRAVADFEFAKKLFSFVYKYIYIYNILTQIKYNSKYL